MAPPPITVYLTTIASQPALRQRQEYILRILQAKKIPFSSYDLASDEDAKKLWRRRAPAGKEQLPGLLVGGKFVGTFQQFEEAVEFDELNIFLKRNEEWDESFEAPSLPTKAVGVPGAHTPMQMTPERIKAKVIAGQPSPLRKTPVPIPINKEPEGLRMDIGGELGGFGLEGVKVTQDELRDLVSQLGLGGNDAEDLIAGLGNPGEKMKPSSSNREPALVKPSAIVQAQPKPLAPLRPKSSKASSLYKEKLKGSSSVPPTPKIEETPTDDPIPSTPQVPEQTSTEVGKAREPVSPALAVGEQTPAAASPLPPVVKEPVVVHEQPAPIEGAPDATPQKAEPLKDLPPIMVHETVRRTASNKSEETLTVDFGSPTSKEGVPYSPMTPLTPQTIVASPETSRLLYKPTEPPSTPTVLSRSFQEKFEGAEPKESA